ncbi:MAG: hypothetical protein JKY03_05835 [Aureispira sp.]|nr:hypothetical protein [Aureispira sp.]
MKKIIFLCSFLFISSLSFAQDCTLVVTNMTGVEIEAGAQTTTATPNVCPPSISGSASVPSILDGTTTMILLGTVLPGDPPIRPFRIGASCVAGGICAVNWQINTCWNPTCVTNFGPFTITVTYCGDYETHVTITP